MQFQVKNSIKRGSIQHDEIKRKNDQESHLDNKHRSSISSFK